MSGYILALDQGTTNTKALALDSDGQVAAKHAVATPIRYPRPGWAEQSGEEIWRATSEAIEGCLARLPEGAKIAAVGISNQRETVLLWRRSTGETIGPCVTWQCRRSADRIDVLRNADVEEQIAAVTGLGLDPLFPAAKIGWLLDAYPEARALATRGDLCAGTIDSWLLYRLTGGAVHATDASNASRTQVFDIHAQAWSPELCALFDVPVGILPRVQDSDAAFGTTVAFGRLNVGVSIRAMMGDSHAALFGHGVRAPGVVKATYGTGSSLMTLIDRPLRSQSGLSTTVAWRRSGRVDYALEGNISVSAQAAAWAADLMGLSDVEALIGLASTVEDAAGVTFVPALAGLGAPHWRDRARAALIGMSLATTRADIARAALEAIGHQICDVFNAMERDLGIRLDELSVDGGATRSDVLMQIQADLLGRPVKRVEIAELSAFGAGALAGLAADFFDDAAITRRLNASVGVISPRLDQAAREAKASLWDAAVRSVIASAAAR